jgi:hypothetical protein
VYVESFWKDYNMNFCLVYVFIICIKNYVQFLSLLRVM